MNPAAATRTTTRTSNEAMTGMSEGFSVKEDYDHTGGKKVRTEVYPLKPSVHTFILLHMMLVCPVMTCLHWFENTTKTV